MIQTGLYRHYKGKLYRVLSCARHSETEQIMVVYQALYDDKGLWARPLAMFDEWVTVKGEQHRRFAYCEQQSLSNEIAILNVIAGQTRAFEQAFAEAQTLLMNADGYINHQLRRCSSDSNRYLLSVDWLSEAHHRDGFRKSFAYQEWRKKLHHFYSPMPTVEHYRAPFLKG